MIRAATSADVEVMRSITQAACEGPAALYPRLGYVETSRQTVDAFDRISFAKELG